MNAIIFVIAISLLRVFLPHRYHKLTMHGTVLAMVFLSATVVKGSEGGTLTRRYAAAAERPLREISAIARSAT